MARTDIRSGTLLWHAAVLLMYHCASRMRCWRDEHLDCNTVSGGVRRTENSLDGLSLRKITSPRVGLVQMKTLPESKQAAVFESDVAPLSE